MKNKDNFQSTTYKYPFCCHPYADNIYEFIVVFDDSSNILEKLEEVFAANNYEHTYRSAIHHMSGSNEKNWFAEELKIKDYIEENLISVILNTNSHTAHSSSIQKSLIQNIKRLCLQEEPDVESSGFLIFNKNYVQLKDVQHVLDKIEDIEKLKRFNVHNGNSISSKELSYVNDLSIF